MSLRVATVMKVGLLSLLVSTGIVLANGAAPVSASSAPPTTTVVLPASGSTVSGTQYFDATASPGTSQVQFELTGSGWVDHVVATATPTIYGWLAAVDTADFYNGTYTLQSVATSDGPVGTSSGVPVTFSNPGPAVNIVLPSAGASVSRSQDDLDAVTGPGVREVEYTLTGNGVTGPGTSIIADASPTLYGWLASWNTTLVPDGTFSLQAIALSTEGPNGYSTPLTITVDNAPPTTSVVLPANGATVSGQLVLDAVASSGVAAVNFLFSGGPNDWSPRTLNGAVRTIYGYVSDVNTLSVPGGMPNGIYTVQSEACSSALVCGTSSSITINVSN